MGITLDISKLDITKDDLGRIVTTSTTLFFETINYDRVDEIEKIITEDEENGVEIPYLNYDTNEYEVYGETLKKIVDKYSITLIGEEVKPNQLYRVEFN